MQKVLVIVGPTGVGKTSLSIELAKEYCGEIISGDSMQVYKEMTIGTAKITEEEMQGIPHYLIDEYSLQDEYNVKVFQDRARASITAIQDKGKLPVICGGTGLYIKSALYDYRFTDQKKDDEFLDFLHSLGNDQLWSMLQLVDPKACGNLHPHNTQRLIRALSMAHTGEKKSSIVDTQDHKMLYDAYIIGLTMDREQLYERINQRVDQMMQQGLLEEITKIVEAFPACWSYQSFQGIGYKEWKAYFEGTMTIEECVISIKKNSRNFAKRQYTWFKNQMQVHWYTITDKDFKNHVKDDCMQWLSK